MLACQWVLMNPRSRPIATNKIGEERAKRVYVTPPGDDRWFDHFSFVEGIPMGFDDVSFNVAAAALAEGPRLRAADDDAIMRSYEERRRP
jgi:hypothetical protein